MEKCYIINIMKLMRKKFTSGTSLLLCILFFGVIVSSDLPYLHNLDADFNIYNIKTLVILEGKHHHEDNPKSPLVDFHKIKINEIGVCPICDVIGNLNFIFSFLTSKFAYKLNSSLIYSIYSNLFPSNDFNISAPRAPPLL